ncbi:CAAX amino terminal protease self- immunity [compost metagenome]
MALIINIISIMAFDIVLITFYEFLASIIIGVTIAAISALLEEYAWRGFLYRELAGKGLIKSAIITAAIWSIWHIPVTILYKYPSNPIKGLLLNLILLFLLSILISYIRYRSGSIIAASLTHGILNTTILSASMSRFSVVSIEILVSIIVVVVIYNIEYGRNLDKKIKNKLSKNI